MTLPSTNLTTRRGFLKTSALSVGAATLLTQGTALADTVSGSVCGLPCSYAETINNHQIYKNAAGEYFRVVECQCAREHKIGKYWIPAEHSNSAKNAEKQNGEHIPSAHAVYCNAIL